MCSDNLIINYSTVHAHTYHACLQPCVILPFSIVSNVTEPISLVPAGRLECTNFTDYEDITEAGRTAAGVIAAIMGSLAQVLGFVLMKYRYKKESGQQ